LNSGSWDDDGQTQAFQPAATGDTTSWNTAADSERRTTSGTYPALDDATETTHVEAPPPYSTFGAGYGSAAVVASWSSAGERGIRGFWLGVIAWVLISAVFALYLWSAVLSSGLREDIRDLIPGL
jgi:hypothetical protein